ncbi:MAG: YfjI family protein [Sneathiella sp.]
MQHSAISLKGVPLNQAASSFAPLDKNIVNGNRSEPPEFPLEVFDEWGPWICESAEKCSAPRDYIAAGLLSVAATTIGNARWVSPSDGWEEPTVLWLAVVGDPSSNKSPALDYALKFLGKLESEMADDFPDKLREYDKDKEVAAAMLEDWKSDVKAAVKDGQPVPPKPEAAVEPEPPIRPRLSVSDTTPEALGHLMGANRKGLLCKRDELAGWFGNFDRYSGGGERSFFTEAFGGREYVIDRVKNNREPLRISHLTIGVIGGVQPEKLSELLSKGADDGFMARFLMVWPDPVPPKRHAGAAHSPKYLDAIRRLKSLEMALDENGNQTPVIKELSPEAADLHFEWRKKNAEEDKEIYGLVRSHHGKLPGIVLRLAVTLEYLSWCLSERPEPENISATSLGYAAHLVDEYFKPMAARVYGDAALPVNEKGAAMVARRIMRDKPVIVNAGDVRRYWKLPGLRHKDTVSAALSVLVECGWLSLIDNKHPDGRSKHDYRVNPQAIGGQS